MINPISLKFLINPTFKFSFNIKSHHIDIDLKIPEFLKQKAKS